MEQWPHIYGALSGSNAISRRKVGLLKRDCRSSQSVGSGKKILTSRGNGAPQETEGRLQVIFLITSGCTDVLGPEESFTFVPPTTTFCLPRLPAASHDYLLPLTTTCYLPQLPAASHVYLLPPTTPSLRPLGDSCFLSASL
jgi:hypothetical protein